MATKSNRPKSSKFWANKEKAAKKVATNAAIRKVKAIKREKAARQNRCGGTRRKKSAISAS